jgi:septal ring factor EnvC (AmiA/AmiB activator)
MKRRFLVLVLSAATLATSAFAGEIYRHVDEQGNVHYLDRPTGESGEQRMDITYSGTSSASVNAQVKRRNDYMATLDEARKETETRHEAEAQARAEMEARAAKCEENRARLESYLQSRRLYRENEAGEREYLDDEQILEARRKAEEAIQETCS